ncbi:hypothetical protein FHT72_006256 [Rhizobium sp. BK077]|nr:hypothetical protein [Rhizobium sp. BK112]MBB3371724.1 hypothetical protein [Rhizobium sp. BK077]MBB4182494.1 hypothetical protein [Rhizobium sp. BK109]
MLVALAATDGTPTDISAGRDSPPARQRIPAAG